MWEQPPESFLNGAISLLPLAILCRLPEETAIPNALREIIRRIDERLARDANHAEAAWILRAAFNLSKLRVKRTQLHELYEGMDVMTDTEMTAYDEMVEELAERERMTARRILLKQGRSRFGDPNPTEEEAVRAIKDIEHLERMADAILKVNNWTELLATP